MTRGFLRSLRRNTIALLALFLALGGTTYAASTALIGRNTVASPQVVNGSLQTKDLSKKARAALKGNRGLRGAAGAQGAQGARGATGSQGPKGTTGVQGLAGATTVTVRQVSTALPASSSASAVADCPAGMKATGGGVNPGGVTSNAAIIKSYPSTGGIGQANDGDIPTAWAGWAQNPTASAATLYVFAICASP